MAHERIMIVDDEIDLACIVRDYLRAEGFSVELCHSGEAALQSFHVFNPQLILLDVMLPDHDGMELCRKFRQDSNVPIMMFSAKNSDIDKILGLGLGADDYISKPFSPAELVARVKAHLRRFTSLTPTRQQEKNLRFGKLEIDLKAYTVKIDNRPAELAAKEFELLSYMAQNPLQVFTREQLFNQVWGFDEYGDINTVTVHIRKIREKIEEDPSKPAYIKTVWGVGYKFDGGV